MNSPLRSRAAAAASAVAVIAMLSPAVAAETDDPAATLHLPRVVNAPGTWSDDEGPDGPLAALGLAPRTTTDGLTGERQSDQMFGVSAVDGRARWIDLPGVDLEQRSLVGWFTLSPDGKHIGWSRLGEPDSPDTAAPLLGWSVMDTTTRTVRDLEPPTEGVLLENASDLTFSGDSRYLVASYDSVDDPQTRDHHFVALDIQDGTSTTLEGPGQEWLPNPGSAQSGVVWGQEGHVFRQDPATGRRESYELGQSVIAVSWSPSSSSFAYLSKPTDAGGGTWVLHVGSSPEDAVTSTVQLDPEPGELLGWTDDQHLVVGHFRRSVQVVDVTTHETRTVDLAGAGEIINSPLLASDLWANPLGEAPPPTGTSDPRRPYLWGAGVMVVLAAGTGLVLVRRGRART